MRLSVMPGARSLKMVVMMIDRREQRGQLGEGDHLRPEVDALAGRVLGAGERHVGEPAGVGADVEHEARRRATARRTGRPSSANAFMRGNATLRVPIISGTR